MRMAMPEDDWLGNLLDHGSIIHIVNRERAKSGPTDCPAVRRSCIELESG
jgi:hypothetical protein